MDDRRAKLEARLKHLENEVDNAFKEYKNFPYYLHAILIHDGNAESGHYYTFIFDRVADKWWRFNDF